MMRVTSAGSVVWTLNADRQRKRRRKHVYRGTLLQMEQAGLADHLLELGGHCIMVRHYRESWD